MIYEGKIKITKLYKNRFDIIPIEGELLKFTNQIQYHIQTNDEIPVYSKSSQYSILHKEGVEKQFFLDAESQNNSTKQLTLELPHLDHLKKVTPQQEMVYHCKTNKNIHRPVKLICLEYHSHKKLLGIKFRITKDLFLKNQFFFLINTIYQGN